MGILIDLEESTEIIVTIEDQSEVTIKTEFKIFQEAFKIEVLDLCLH